MMGLDHFKHPLPMVTVVVAQRVFWETRSRLVHICIVCCDLRADKGAERMCELEVAENVLSTA